MSNQPLPEVHEHSARAKVLIENWNRIHQAINNLNAMTHSNDHNEYGLSSHEKTHQVESLKNILKRINDGLAIEIPEPAPEKVG